MHQRNARTARRTDTPEKSARELLAEAVPPQNLLAERAVLGAILRDPKCIGSAAQLLKEEDFYSDSHQKIWNVMFDCFECEIPIDPLLVGQELKRKGWLDDVSEDTLVEMFDQEITSANIHYYARIVKEMARRRHAAHVAIELLRGCYEPREEPEKFVAWAESKIQEIERGEIKRPSPETKEVVTTVIDAIKERMATKAFKGVPTGFHDLDEIILGLSPGDVTIIAARPGMGKSALALCIADHVAFNLKKTVYFASAEMRKEELVERHLSMVAEVDGKKMRKGTISKEENERVVLAAARVAGKTLIVDEMEEDASFMSLRNSIRQEMTKRPIDLVIIDYLQLLHGERTNKNSSRQEEVAGISRGIKRMAMKLGVHVIALSQLNRGVEARTNSVPKMSDLRESGAIEQDASNIVLIHRPEEYDKSERPGEADLIVCKVRNGQTKNCAVLWQSAYTRFVNKAKSYQQEFPE